MNCPIHPHASHHVHNAQGQDRAAFEGYVKKSVRDALSDDPSLKAAVEFFYCWGDTTDPCGYYAATPSKGPRIVLRWEDFAYQWSQERVDELICTYIAQHRSQSVTH